MLCLHRNTRDAAVGKVGTLDSILGRRWDEPSFSYKASQEKSKHIVSIETFFIYCFNEEILFSSLYFSIYLFRCHRMWRWLPCVPFIISVQLVDVCVVAWFLFDDDLWVRRPFLGLSCFHSPLIVRGRLLMLFSPDLGVLDCGIVDGLCWRFDLIGHGF